MAPDTDTRNAWLSTEELEIVRGQVPLVYVDAIPVRVATDGTVSEVGLLLRALSDGSVSRAIVTGRVHFGERIRDALLRHLEKDLGPLALPRVPPALQPFTVAEYFPDPAISGFYDPRQHAVSLAYVVPVDGECRPSHDALDLAWLTPEEVCSMDVGAEMTAGHHRLVRMGLAYTGTLP